jgi:NADPH2:quinone reductase
MGGAGRDAYQPDFSVMMGQNKTFVSYYQGAELMMNGARARANVQRLIDEVGQGELQVVIDERFPLSKASDAHALIESRKVFGRVILVPDDIGS